MFSTDAVKPACEEMIISLTSSSKWVENQTHNKIPKYRVGCVDLTAMVTVYKKHLYFQNNLGSVHKVFFIVR